MLSYACYVHIYALISNFIQKKSEINFLYKMMLKVRFDR